MLRLNRLVCAGLWITLSSYTLLAEDVDEVRGKGIEALKASQVNPRAIVAAARFFVKASAMYSDAGNDEKSVEMNSFLYWCKKKMTLDDIDAFTKGGEAAVTSKLAAIEKLVPAADEAQSYFDRAEQFATKNPSEHLLVAIRFYEVADRFKGSDAGMKALDRSLKEQLQDKSNGGKTALPPVEMRPPDNAPATSGNRAVPPSDDVKQAEKLIKDLFKEEYAKTDAAGHLAIAAKLMQQVDENKNDPASDYALLHEGRDHAVLGGDAALATVAQKRLRDGYKIDFVALLADLKKLEVNVKSADTANVLATLYALGADDAVTVDNYDQAVRFNSRAEDLLPLIKNPDSKAHLKSEIARVQALRQASGAAMAAIKTLATKPDDANANLTAGKFALQRGEYERAFAMLAKSKDSALQSLAKRELEPSTQAADQVALADGWFDRAEKETNTYVKAGMQERAALWYNNALPALNGLAKMKVETRLKGLASSKTPGGINKGEVASHVINLLKLVDPAKDSVEGQWTQREGTLVSDHAQHSRIEMPYHPSEEYDYRIVFARVQGNDCISFPMSHLGKQFNFTIGAYGNKLSGFEQIDGHIVQDTSITLKFGIKNNQKYTVTLQVRKASLTAIIDGKICSQMKTDYMNLSIHDSWKMRQSDLLGIGHFEGEFIIYSADLIAVTGSGKPSR